MAIIIDAFLGHAETFSLPIKQYEINEFARVWSLYDPEATGFILTDDLDSLIVDLANNEETKELIVLRELILEDENARNRFIGKLKIPLYEQFKKVMYYDVLQQLCHKKNLLEFNKEKINKERIMMTMLKAFGAKFTDSYDPINIVMGRKQETIVIDFDKTIKDLGDMDASIELMQSLHYHSIRVHYEITHTADTLTNIHLTHEERKNMDDEELVRISRLNVEEDDDIYLYTTLHVYYTNLIKNRWLVRVKERRPEIFAPATPTK